MCVLVCRVIIIKKKGNSKSKGKSAICMQERKTEQQTLKLKVLLFCFIEVGQ